MIIVRCLSIVFCILVGSPLFAKKIIVSNADQLQEANRLAQPGDTIQFKNGTWNDIVMQLNASGTEQHPIVFKAETRGKVIISGRSQLQLGGNYLVIDGLLFQKGYAPSGDVIEFRINSKQPANHCRVTSCVINDFNKPKRMDEDQWVAFYGKNNRLDHCSFYNKKNMGVLLAVHLDDERSRENDHFIDHNYFGIRPPLASNGGEIIRVGVSEHATFNSNTQISFNFFEHCDGETEVISIKSGRNKVINNVFKECQGSVVLRHGDNNTVVNNLFLGNGKEATGGVRVINRGQWIINNFFYKCRGETFRSPLAIMNGIPNSPANRYVQVSDAVIMNNIFVDCAPMSFGEGSDAERTLPPANVLFARNIFYNKVDTRIYKKWDDIQGIRFSENIVNQDVKQQLEKGFTKTTLSASKANHLMKPYNENLLLPVAFDSLLKKDPDRFANSILQPGASDENSFNQLLLNTKRESGAKWFVVNKTPQRVVTVTCNNSDDIYKALKEPQAGLILKLTGTSYSFDKPLVITGNVLVLGNSKNSIIMATAADLPALFILKNKGALSLSNLSVNGKDLNAFSMVASDTSGSPEHFNLTMNKLFLTGMRRCQHIVYVRKSTLADSIIIRNSVFHNFSNGFALAEEKDNRGYYNAEKIQLTHNQFINGQGVLLNVYRGGNDESTLGPDLVFGKNVISNCHAPDGLILLTGVQKTKISDNRFVNCNAGKDVVVYKDIVRAKHLLSNNLFKQSGGIVKNDFVSEKNNVLE